MYLAKAPLFLKWFYPSLTWNKSRLEKTVYLTFDDGPIPNVTEFVLNTLKTFDIKATFFCIGDNIQKHPHIFEKIAENGHRIGNHTFNHLNGWKTDAASYFQNFLKCQELTQSNLFRPPYGRIKKKQIRLIQKFTCTADFNPQIPNPQPATHNPQLIMWDVLSGDFDLHLSGEECLANVTRNSQNGSIIVFHDSVKAFDRLQYALPRSIEYLLTKGFQFGRL